MNAESKSGIQVESVSELSGNWRHSRRSRLTASTGSLPPVLELDRYMAAACSLMLLVVLSVGAVGYAGIRGSFDAVAEHASPHAAERNREADPDRVVTPAAVTLVLIAALLMAIAAPRAGITTAETSLLEYPIDTDRRASQLKPNSQYAMPRNTSSFIKCK